MILLENHGSHKIFKFSRKIARFTENVTAVKSRIRLFPMHTVFALRARILVSDRSCHLRRAERDSVYDGGVTMSARAWCW